MKAKTTNGRKSIAPAKQPPALPTWDTLRFQGDARFPISFGSPDLAEQDAKLHILKRRLPRLEATDHTKYVDITSARMVERLRAVRDAYRTPLEKRGAKSIPEMYSDVFRNVVKPLAVDELRRVAFEYIGYCQIRSKDWDALFEIPSPPGPLPWESQHKRLTPTVQADNALSKRIGELVGQDVFDEGSTGGPFGRDGQIEFARSMFGLTLLTGEETLPETFDRRQALWDKCYPWTEGLAMLFDAAQEELYFQRDALSYDCWRAESTLKSLTDYQRIVHEHLYGRKSRRAPSGKPEIDWSELLGELDQCHILPEAELTGAALEAFKSVGETLRPAKTWIDCYDSRIHVHLTTSKARKATTLSREVTHAIPVKAAAVNKQRSKVLGSKVQ